MNAKRIVSRVIYERHRWMGRQSSVSQTKEHGTTENVQGRATSQTAKTVETRQTRAVVLRRVLAGVVVSTVGIATLVVGAESAAAAGTFNTTGSVNVRSGPGTNYGVVAGEPSGASFSLICQWQHGTSVGGNATWDRVQFGNGVTGAISDYWTTTPSWNSYAPGTPDCTQTPPAPVPSGREAKALSWAYGELGRYTDDWGRPTAGWCARWSVGAYGRLNSGYSTAWTMYGAFRSMGLTHTGNAPAGAFVFFQAARVNGWGGHVAISDGAGGMITTSTSNIKHTSLSYAGAPYVGWSYAPGGWTR